MSEVGFQSVYDSTVHPEIGEVSSVLVAQVDAIADGYSAENKKLNETANL